MRVLYIENNKEEARLVQEKLTASKKEAFHVTPVDNFSEASALLQTDDNFDVALIDFSRADNDRLSIINSLQALAPTLPVVVIVNPEDKLEASTVLPQGIQDTMVKGQYDSSQLVRSLVYAVQRSTSQERLAYMAQHDEVTGLPNRTLFRDRLSRALARAYRNGWSVGLLLLDLNGFTSIYDEPDSAGGGEILKTVADRLKSLIRMEDTVSRLEAAEFGIILEKILRPEDAGIAAKKIINALGPLLAMTKQSAPLTASVGIALYPQNSHDIDMLIKNADIAMYRAKERSGSHYHFYIKEMNDSFAERQNLETAMRAALDRAEYQVYYQPQIDLSTGKVIAMEALLRWMHPKDGLLSPNNFLQFQEETGIIIPVGKWLLREACKQVKQWSQQGMTDIRVTVNLSPRQFLSKELVDDVADALEENALDSEQLEIDITEKALMANPDYGCDTLSSLKMMGVKITLDDFGTGYFNLRDLRRFPIDSIKIDRTFTKGIAKNMENSSITNAIISLGHNLGLDVVAEGVETAQQLAYLHSRGCDAGQGYLFSQPLPADRLTPLVKNDGKGWRYENQIKAALGLPLS